MMQFPNDTIKPSLPPHPHCPFNSYINCHSPFVCNGLCQSWAGAATERCGYNCDGLLCQGVFRASWLDSQRSRNDGSEDCTIMTCLPSRWMRRFAANTPPRASSAFL